MKPVNDQLTITVTLSDMDNFVFCVGTKKAIANLHKTLQDVVCLFIFNLSLKCTIALLVHCILIKSAL